MKGNLENIEDKFDKDFRTSLREIEMNPPADMWSKISAELNHQEFETSATKPTVKSKFSFWKYRIAAAILVLVSIPFAFELLNSNQPTQISLGNFLPNLPIFKTEKKENANTNNELAVIQKVTKNAKNNFPKTVKNVMPKAIAPNHADDANMEVATPKLAENDTNSSNEIEALHIPTQGIMKVGISNPIMNDEIKILVNPNEKKSKAEKQIIILEKKYNKQPTIEYTLPFRF